MCGEVSFSTVFHVFFHGLRGGIDLEMPRKRLFEVRVEVSLPMSEHMQSLNASVVGSRC